MKKGLKKAIALASAVAMLGGTASALVACKPDSKPVNPVDLKQGTYRAFTTVVPGMWNDLNATDANADSIKGNINSNFFSYDYRFDESKGGKYKADGSVNADAIVDGAFVVDYDAAVALDDVTKEYKDKWSFTDKQVESGGYAWKITLRQDLQWDDGTPIKAQDFVYSMEQQLDPDFMNARASEYYNNAVKLINARNYVYAGTREYNSITTAEGSSLVGYIDNDDIAVDGDGYATYDGKIIVININDGNNWGGSLKDSWDEDKDTLFAGIDFAPVIEKADSDGYALLTKADINVITNMIARLHGKNTPEEYAETAGDYAYQEWQEFAFLRGDILADISFDKVGITAASDYELVIGLAQPLALKNEDGSLSYNAAYSMASLPLVKEDLYERCKVAPNESSTLWTSTYCTSLDTTASWGAYKLTSYQSDRAFTLERNDKWYGYQLESNKNQYNITKITYDKIADTNTQWLKFFAGEIDSKGLDVNHIEDYGRSVYATYSPRVAMFSFNLYANLDVLKAGDRNNGILAITDFRKAVSLALDRDAYLRTLSPQNQPCYGLLDNSYFYDIANSTMLEDGGVYRNTEQAKKAVLRAYGYTENQDGTWSNGGLINNATLEDAYESVNGYDLTKAKELVNKAYKELTDNAEKYGYDSSKKITILLGASEEDDITLLEHKTVQGIFAKMVEGTDLEGKIEVKLDSSFGDNWDSAFIAGEYDLCTGGVGNAPFDPFYMISAYLEPSFALTQNNWNAESETMTFKMPAGDYEGAGQELTMSMMNWYRCLNGSAKANDKHQYNWGNGFVDASVRLEVLAAMEEFFLTKYYSIPYASGQTASLLSAKFSYITKDYNTFMGFGGMRYMVVNYTDEEWTAFVKTVNNGDLSNFYKETV